MPKHTPPPWRASDILFDEGAVLGVTGSDGRPISFMTIERDEEENLANAHMEAASLELYVALKHFMRATKILTDEYGLFRRQRGIAERAIAKAEGRRDE